jgi:hypothetical protein
MRPILGPGWIAPRSSIAKSVGKLRQQSLAARLPLLVTLTVHWLIDF